MKKQKDPRQTLSFYLKFSIIILLVVPFLYVNIKFNKIINIALVFVVCVIVWFLTKKFSSKDVGEYKLHNAIIVGYMFSGLWLFFALIAISIIISYYSNQISFPYNLGFIMTTLLLFFSFVLFYLANKSRSHEKRKFK